MTSKNSGGTSARKIGWLSLVVIVALAMTIVVAPVFIIQPFKAQTERGLSIALAMRAWSPLLTVIAVVISFVLVAWLWSASRRWFAKAALVTMMLPLLAATWFARQNHFEWMFHPLAHSAYAPVGEATFVSDSDMVLAVEGNGEAVAYPVRLMAYHHLVQDVVGGVPIVATY